MVGVKKRSPTNKEFKSNFQKLAATKTKKGHLTNQEREADDVAKENGILVRINRKKLYEKGWEVKVGTGNDAVTYMCSYGDGVMYIPDCTVTDEYFVPKGNVEVEITVDKKTKIYTVTKINSTNKKPIALFENILTLSTDTNTDTNKKNTASIVLSSDSVNINSDKVTITDSDDNQIDLKESQQQINDLQDENKEIKDQVDSLSKENDNLIKRIQILEEKVSKTEEKEEETEEKEEKTENGE